MSLGAHVYFSISHGRYGEFDRGMRRIASGILAAIVKLAGNIGGIEGPKFYIAAAGILVGLQGPYDSVGIPVGGNYRRASRIAKTLAVLRNGNRGNQTALQTELHRRGAGPGVVDLGLP